MPILETNNPLTDLIPAIAGLEAVLELDGDMDVKRIYHDWFSSNLPFYIDAYYHYQ